MLICSKVETMFWSYLLTGLGLIEKIDVRCDASHFPLPLFCENIYFIVWAYTAKYKSIKTLCEQRQQQQQLHKWHKFNGFSRAWNVQVWGNMHTIHVRNCTDFYLLTALSACKLTRMKNAFDMMLVSSIHTNTHTHARALSHTLFLKYHMHPQKRELLWSYISIGSIIW